MCNWEKRYGLSGETNILPDVIKGVVNDLTKSASCLNGDVREGFLFIKEWPDMDDLLDAMEIRRFEMEDQLSETLDPLYLRLGTLGSPLRDEME